MHFAPQSLYLFPPSLYLFPPTSLLCQFPKDTSLSPVNLTKYFRLHHIFHFSLPRNTCLFSQDKLKAPLDKEPHSYLRKLVESKWEWPYDLTMAIMCAGTQTTWCPFCPEDNNKVNSLWFPWTPTVDEQSGCLSSWAALLLSVTWCASCDCTGKHLPLVGVGYNENRTLLQPGLGSTVTTLTLACGVNSIDSMFSFSWEAFSCFPMFLLLAYNTSSSVIPLFQLSPLFKAQVVSPSPQIHRFLGSWCHRAWGLESL